MASSNIAGKKGNFGIILGPNHQDVDNHHGHQIGACRLSSDIQLHKRAKDTSWGTSVWSTRKGAREEKKKRREGKKIRINGDDKLVPGVVWQLSFCLK